MLNYKTNMLGSIAALACMLMGAAAERDMPKVDTCTTSKKTYNKGDVIHERDVCLVQGEGDWTWFYYPASAQEGGSFCILDNNCKVVGGASRPKGSTPYTWTANYLPYVLTVKYATEPYPNEPSFRFDYGDGEFASDDNGCECAGNWDAGYSCKCAFPIGGKVDH